MESVLGIIFSAENVRILALLAFGFGAYVLLKSQMKGQEYYFGKRMYELEASLSKRIDELDKKIDGVEASLLKAMDAKIDSFHAQLKSNDFAHLNNTIEALTYRICGFRTL